MSDCVFERNSFDICRAASAYGATASASVTTAISRPTRTLAKKANCSSPIWDFFGFDRFKWVPY